MRKIICDNCFLENDEDYGTGPVFTSGLNLQFLREQDGTVEQTFNLCPKCKGFVVSVLKGIDDRINPRPKT